MSPEAPTSIRYFKPTNRLAKMVRLPGGKTVESAVKAAEAAIEHYRPAVVADIDGWISELEQLATDAAPSQITRERVYRVASSILEHAGLFDLTEVGQAAYSLCDLVDRLAETGRWDCAAVAVHVGSIRLLREMTGDVALQRQELLRGLHAVVAKVAEAA